MNNRSIYFKTSVLLSLLIMCLLFAGSGNSLHAASRKKIVVGQTKQLTKKAKKWKSSNTRVIKVTKSGKITALRAGKCTITAYKGKKKVKWKYQVIAPKLSYSKKTVKVNKSFTLKLKNSNTAFSWKVSDTSVLKLTKKSKYKYKVKGLRNGTAKVTVKKGTYSVTCTVTVGTGVPDQEETENKEEKSEIQTLYMDGNVFKQMTWNRTGIAKYVSSISKYGQSAPLYQHKDGGDGLENIWADKNNGAVGVSGAQLSSAAVKGTIQKACLWARAVADSDYHGYDYGHSYEDASLMNAFGQAKPNGLGTGDYCCSTIPLCAYYFAGVNVLGENLGGSDAKYIPHTTKLFYGGLYNGVVTFYEDGVLKECRYLSNYEWRIFRYCGFTDVVDQFNANKDGFVFKAGDVVTANGHTQLVLTSGTRKTAETVQAYGPDKVKSGKMPKGGDQSGEELGRTYYVRTKPKIRHIMRFTGKGVKLNTVGLIKD